MENYCLYKDESFKQEPKILLRRFDDGASNRFYYGVDESGSVKIYAGITSVIQQVLPESAALVGWKVSKAMNGEDPKQAAKIAADYGTLMHIIFAEWIQKHFPAVDALIKQAESFCVEHSASRDMPRKDLLAFLRWYEDYKVEPILLEAMLVNEPINGQSHALTLDNLCRISIKKTYIEDSSQGVYQSGPRKGQDKIIQLRKEKEERVLCLVDYKSNFAAKESKRYFDSHVYQLVACRDAVRHNFGVSEDILLANFSPLAWRSKPDYEFKIHDVKAEDLELYRRYMELAQLRGLFEPSGTIISFTGYTTSNDYKIMDYRSFIEEKIKKENETNKIQ